MCRVIGVAVSAFAFVALGLSAPVRSAQPFDHYVLALSWSPNFCEREARRGHPLQCGRDRRFGFIVHGLWPDRDDRRLSYCAAAQGGQVSDRLVRSMLDVMPSPALVRSQWRKHGTCSGLAPADYFATLREAFARIEIPSTLNAPEQITELSPAAIRAQFRQANPALPEAGIFVRCERDRLIDVRICLTPSLAFRACPNVTRRRCRDDSIAVLPVGAP